MSWPMPTPAAAGVWNPNAAVGSAMAPDMSMGNYTTEQWAALQQQNWQQWTQWQQQYAQWQTQYGEKYTQQMQAMQAMQVMPPLPVGGAPPPAPPPPEKPPPPPPHENNQPLYSSSQPAPVPAPSTQRNTNIVTGNFTGNNVAAEPLPDSSQSVNSEALKKLAEEERLFDIQFQKWEEEIEKWRRDNVNHPDKQAYNEYEAKFEACRVQLLERRQQMKQRRARLLGNIPASAVGNNPSSTVPPKQNLQQNVMQNVQAQNYNSKPYHNSQNQQYNNAPSSSYTRSNNKNIDPQDRYESYQNIEDYSGAGPPESDFLPRSESNKGIPGLDLVPDGEKKELTVDAHPRAPDYTTISKGINNILGDEKIMNMLSMVCGQNAPGSDQHPPNIQQHSGPSGPGGSYGVNRQNYNAPPNNQWGNNNQQHGNRQPPPYGRQGPPALMDVNPFRDRQLNNNNQSQISQDHHYEPNQNSQYMGGGPRSEPPRMRPPLQDMSGQQNINDHRKGPFDNRNIPLDAGVHENNIPINQAMSVNQSMPMNQPMPMNRHMNQPMPMNQHMNQPMPVNQPTRPKPKWVEDPLFTPSIIVEYEHKRLRLKARDFIEPVHMFEYNHKSKDEEYKKQDFEKEVDELFTRKPRRYEDDHFPDNGDRFSREYRVLPREHREPLREYREPPREYREPPREYREPPKEFREPPREHRELSREYERRPKDYEREIRPREEFEERRRPENQYYDRRRDDRFASRREDLSRDNRYRDREVKRSKSRSRERETRKRARSRESETSTHSKKSKESESKVSNAPKHIIMIDDILESPGRETRPEKIVIILRGPPGSGKSYLAKLIRDREAEYRGAARIMSIDDYFMQEGEIEEKDPTTGKTIKKPTMKYEYDESLEETYLNSLKRAFKRSLTDGYFNFLIYDAVNDQLKGYADIWNFARQNGFQVYICTMELDPQVCFKRNIHNRSLEDIEVISSRFFPTPSHHITLDATTLLQNAAIPDVHMEDAIEDLTDEVEATEVESSFTSKWEKMDDAVQLARLDGTSKPLRPSQLSMEDYLQLEEWTPTQAKPGKKTVRWADIEERRQQEKMRAIGFVVGQTDWNRMTDPTMGSSALTQTKYIERVRRN